MSFDGHFINWNQVRIKAIVDHYGHQFFFHKKILDLGCGHGDISGVLHRLGADVTAVDARQEHLKIVSKKYDGVKVVKADLDRPWPFFGKVFDLTLDMDLICYLGNFEEHLKTVCASSNYLILETAVVDSSDPNFCVVRSDNKNSYEGSFNGYCTQISATNIERVLKSCGMTFKRMDNAKFNSGLYVYNWQSKNDDSFDINKRRIWFCIKEFHTHQNESSGGVTSPILVPNTGVFSPNLMDSKIPIIHKSVATTRSPSPPTGSQNPQPGNAAIFQTNQQYNKDMRFVDNSPNFINNKLTQGNMRVKIFIVTYRSNQLLNTNLESMFSSDVMPHNPQIVVINNHSDFYIDPKFNSNVQVLHNNLRPDFSTGHLSRNWNQAIINGFKDLNNPDCDMLITCQVDTTFNSGWFNNLCKLHQQYSLIQYGAGDNFVSYLPDAVRKIGIWDERFCNIGYQEADYFIRALMYNKLKTTINDYVHNRILNPINVPIINKPPVDPVHFDDHIKSTKYHKISAQVFKRKYGGIHPEGWSENLKNNPPRKSSIENYVFYPYFEKDVEDLIGKGYVWAEHHIY